VGANADDLHASFLEEPLLILGDRGAVDGVLVLDPDLELLRILAQSLGDQFRDRFHGLRREGAGPRPGTDVVRKTARGEFRGKSVCIPVELVVGESGFARRARDGADVTTDESVDVVAVRELLNGGDALLRAARVAAHDDHLAAEDSSGRVDLFGGQFVAAIELVAVERERTRQRVHGSELEILGLGRRSGHGDGGGGGGKRDVPK
jgi:hypothetical protein